MAKKRPLVNYQGDVKELHLLDVVPSPVLLLKDSTGGQDLNTITPTAVDFDTVDIIDSNFFERVSNTEYKIKVAGKYKVSFNIAVESDNNTRRNVVTILEVDGFQPTETAALCYIRNNNNPYASMSLPSIEVDIDEDDIVRVLGYRMGDSGDATTIADTVWTRLEYVG